MAKFQFRVVGNYFGSPFERPNNAGTGSIIVDYDQESVPSVRNIMDEVSSKVAEGKIKNCISFSYTYDPNRKTPPLLSIRVVYSKQPLTGEKGAFNYLLQQYTEDYSYDIIPQYYVYEVEDFDNPTDLDSTPKPIKQINRSGDRIFFSQSLSEIRGFKYNPNGKYLIIWRFVKILKVENNSVRFNAQLKRLN